MKTITKYIILFIIFLLIIICEYCSLKFVFYSKERQQQEIIDIYLKNKVPTPLEKFFYDKNNDGVVDLVDYQLWGK